MKTSSISSNYVSFLFQDGGKHYVVTGEGEGHDVKAVVSYLFIYLFNTFLFVLFLFIIAH